MPTTAKNPAFRKAQKLAAKIPYRKNKRRAILAWCKAIKKAIG